MLITEICWLNYFRMLYFEQKHLNIKIWMSDFKDVSTRGWQALTIKITRFMSYIILSICLLFQQKPWYAYKRYAYKKHVATCYFIVMRRKTRTVFTFSTFYHRDLKSLFSEVLYVKNRRNHATQCLKNNDNAGL